MDEIFHDRRISGIRKNLEYLYRLFDVLRKQEAYKIEALQSKVYIQH